MNEYDVAFKKLVSLEPSSWKELGFKSQGAYRRKPINDDITHVFWLQRFPTPYIPDYLEKEFRVNIGVFSRSLLKHLLFPYNIEIGKEDPTTCGVETTGGFLIDGKDSTLKYYPEDDFAFQAKRFVEQVSVGIKWMIEYSNPKSWESHFVSKKWWNYAAAGAVLAGESKLAKRYMDLAIFSRFKDPLQMASDFVQSILTGDYPAEFETVLSRSESSENSFIQSMHSWKRARGL